MGSFCGERMKSYTCKICGKEFKSVRALGGHIRAKEGLSPKDYYDRFCNGKGVCEKCGVVTTFRCLSVGYDNFCSTNCANLGTVEKKRKTCLKKYGVDNVSKVDAIKKKRTQTFIERFGVDNPWKNEQVKQKIRSTNKKRYGNECSALNEEVKKKKKKTLNERYGVDHYSETEEYKRKIVSTCQSRYHVDNVFQLDAVKEKSKKSSLKKYGVEFPAQSEKIKEKNKKTSIEKYGVDNYAKTDEFREFARNMLIDDIEKRLLNGEPLGPRIGKLERACLDLLQCNCKYTIIRQSRIHGYFPDGFIKELNLIVEFYEKWHNKPKFLEKDVYREEYLIKKTGCIFFIIKEDDWLYNKSEVIEKFKQLTK